MSQPSNQNIHHHEFNATMTHSSVANPFAANLLSKAKVPSKVSYSNFEVKDTLKVIIALFQKQP
jgi:hypothetical protein